VLKDGKGDNRFLIVFFGIIITFQLIGIALRGFQANKGQIIGISIGILGYMIILYNEIKNKRKK